jgi:N-methylhydantoinase B/oxoprolinase/acetone carboxylase alpha subunit
MVFGSNVDMVFGSYLNKPGDEICIKKTNYSGCGSPQNNNGSSVSHRHWDNKKIIPV